MTRWSTLVVGLCVLGIVGVASAAPETSSGKRAALVVTDLRPVEIRGTGFKSQERVQVRLRARGAVLTKTKVASRAGVFRLEFAVSVGSCGGLTVQALGSGGTRAWMSARNTQLDCLPAEHVGRYYPDPRAGS